MTNPFSNALRLAIVGYGRMGQAVEAAAIERGHKVAAIVRSANDPSWAQLTPDHVDLAIEFTHPTAFRPNLQRLVAAGLPVVTGTTGWDDETPAVHALQQQHRGAVVHGANFSVGVMLLTKLTAQLAQWMNNHPDYDVGLEDRHHRHKADSPSGTANLLAQTLLQHLDRKTAVANPGDLNQRPPLPHELGVAALRAGAIVGEHRVVFSSGVDQLELRHQAFSRGGFAHGAVWAASWLHQRAQLGPGWWSFADLFDEPATPPTGPASTAGA